MWEKKGVMKLFTAFSREQETKDYVQHRMMTDEVAALLW